MRTRNFTLQDVIHTPEKELPKDLLPIAYVALGYVQCLRDALSENLGKEIRLIVTSGYRSPAHNKKEGGQANSYHVWRFDAAGVPIWALDLVSPDLTPDDLYVQIKEMVRGETYQHLRLGFVHIAPYGTDQEWKQR